MKKPTRRERMDRKALLFDQLASLAVSVRFPHPNGAIVVERSKDARSIAPVLERVLSVLTTEEVPDAI